MLICKRILHLSAPRYVRHIQFFSTQIILKFWTERAKESPLSEQKRSFFSVYHFFNERVVVPSRTAKKSFSLSPGRSFSFIAQFFPFPTHARLQAKHLVKESHSPSGHRLQLCLRMFYLSQRQCELYRMLFHLQGYCQ